MAVDPYAKFGVSLRSMSNQPPHGHPYQPGYGPSSQGNWPPGYGYPPQQPPPKPKPPRSTGEIAAIVFGVIIAVITSCAVLGAVVAPPKTTSATGSAPPTTSSADDDPAVGQVAYAYSRDEHGAIDVFPTIEMARVGDDQSPAGTLARQRRKRLLEGCKVRRTGGNARFPEVEVLEGPWRGQRLFGFWLHFHTKQKPGITTPVY